MLGWARRGEQNMPSRWRELRGMQRQSARPADGEVNVHEHHEPMRAELGCEPSDSADLMRGLRLLTFNIQVGITTSRYHHYVTNGWKHVLPHESRNHNLRRIADVVADYDFVALQEADAGSLRSGFINQVEYIADRAQFPYWYSQLNRDLAPFARHASGLLSRISPDALEDHRLPGAIRGRGAIAVRLPYGDSSVLIVLLHLSLGERSRAQQLEYVKGIIDGEEHVVVMGDMNSHLAQLLFNSPLAETDLRPAESVQPTYPSWRPQLALDHVLVSPSLAIHEYEVLDCRLSDHRPIAVTLTQAHPDLKAAM